MGISDRVKQNVGYGKELLASSIEGASNARKAVLESEEHSGLVRAAAQESWQAAAIGVLAGVALGVMADNHRNGSPDSQYDGTGGAGRGHKIAISSN